ncbi:MAG: response regulator [Deltaproteobacteria bacterium]|jgi:CheY-like chemotaxis protein|nr:MAG: response regulator [Deltaproteobacteria bacterium]
MGNRILVVDDNHDIVNIVESWLKANDYEVYTAYSGEEGLEKSKLLKPDAVILDIMMPDIDGASVAAEMKKDPGTHQIPIIFLTGAVKSSELPKNNIVGGQYFLAKPFKGIDLLKMLRLVIFGRMKY